jgi:hypothetical protein
MKNKAFPGHVCFYRVGKVKFWLTTENIVYLIVDGHIIFPYLSGERVTFDDLGFSASLKVREDLTRILSKQREIRMGWSIERTADELAHQNLEA